MTTPQPPGKIKDEKIVFHDAKGFVTEDKSKAVSAEVTQTKEDGTVVRTILHKN